MTLYRFILTSNLTAWIFVASVTSAFSTPLFRRYLRPVFDGKRIRTNPEPLEITGVLRFVLIITYGHLFASFLQDAPEFCPTAHWFGRGDKSCVPLNKAENHEVIVSIYTLNPPNTVLHLSIPVCSTCSSASPYTVALSLSTAHLSSRSGTTSVLFLPYRYFTTASCSCEYSF